MKLSTGKGDDGTTGTLGAGRVSKSSSLIEVLGDLDETNAWIGMCLAEPATPDQLRPMLKSLQDSLLAVGAEIASDGDVRFVVPSLDVLCDQIEHDTDSIQDALPPLTVFVLPGGCEAAARLHVLRTVVRRLERSMSHYAEQSEVRPILRVFVNRLSDWAFAAARLANHEAGNGDDAWRRSL